MLRSSVSGGTQKFNNQAVSSLSRMPTCRTLSQTTHDNSQLCQCYRSIFVLIEQHENFLEFWCRGWAQKRRKKKNNKVTVVIRQMSFEMLTIKFKKMARILIEFCGKQSLKVGCRRELWNFLRRWLDQNRFALTKHFNFNVP